jgi:two-component system sensor histidine kinase KdpD
MRAARDARWRGWSNAVAVVALCTLVSEVFDPYIEHASAATIYLAGVVYVALRLGQSAAMLAVVLSILAFDLLVVEPRWSFKPTDTQYYFTFLVMLIVGMLISRLADQAREQTNVAEARARRAQALNELASHLVSAQSERDIGDGLAVAVQTTFGVPSALLLPDDQGRLADQSGFCRRMQAADAQTALRDELTLAQQAFDEGRSTETAGGPSEPEQLLCLPLPSANGTLGVFVVRLPASRSNSPEDRRLLDAFANQAALALERSLFEQRSAAAVLDAESERLRSTVLSGISHDFRTPLTTIIGAATSLLEQSDALDALRRKRLQQSILDEARRMHSSMSDLLDLTRMEEGTVQVCCEWCPADDLIDEACQALARRLQVRTVNVQVPPEAVVWCDARLVEQVLVNLLDNALRHTPAHCTLQIGIELADDVWRLTVADDGPGLPPGQEGEVFKKFFRARSEPAGAGTGLGLAICAAVARLHHGTIVAANDGGARFTLTLPQPAAPSASLDEVS